MPKLIHPRPTSVAMVALLAGLSIHPSAGAQTRDSATAQRYAEEVVRRLNLTDAQRQALRPVLQKAAKERRAILAKHGITEGSRPSMRQMRAAKPELDGARKRTRREVSKILDAAQMKEYDKIVAEVRAKMRDQYRGRR